MLDSPGPKNSETSCEWVDRTASFSVRIKSGVIDIMVAHDRVTPITVAFIFCSCSDFKIFINCSERRFSKLGDMTFSCRAC